MSEAIVYRVPVNHMQPAELRPSETGYDVVMIEHYQALRDENARLRRGLENCHMLARRIVVSESTFFKIDSANHIIRMCEEAGVTSVKGVLRDAALQPEREGAK